MTINFTYTASVHGTHVLCKTHGLLTVFARVISNICLSVYMSFCLALTIICTVYTSILCIFLQTENSLRLRRSGYSVWCVPTLRFCHALRTLASYEAKIAKICHFWYILASYSSNKPSFQNPTKSLFAQRSICKWSFISWITGQIVQKLQIFAIFAS